MGPQEKEQWCKYKVLGQKNLSEVQDLLCLEQGRWGQEAEEQGRPCLGGGPEGGEPGAAALCWKESGVPKDVHLEVTLSDCAGWEATLQVRGGQWRKPYLGKGETNWVR